MNDTVGESIGDSIGESSDETAIRDMLRLFRQRQVEPAWDALDRVDAARFADLRQALRETGLPDGARPEADGGIALSPLARHTALAALGAAHPALATALVSHLSAQALIVEANGGRWPEALPTDASCAVIGSPLDAAPETPFTLTTGQDGVTRLSGSRRAMPCHADFLVVPAWAATAARAEDGLRLCVVPADSVAAGFRPVPSSHGLCLLPFGEIDIDGLALADSMIFAWPSTGYAAHEADGLLASLIAGMVDELAQRAIDYARQRPQAGVMIIEHHAVQQLVGPIEMARFPLRALALAALSTRRAGDGAASAFAVQIARRSALDAIQTFGGYGYMQDCRIERYLRDANTLETFWIHAAARERDAAVRRSNALARGEAA